MTDQSMAINATRCISGKMRRTVNGDEEDTAKNVLTPDAELLPDREEYRLLSLNCQEVCEETVRISAAVLWIFEAGTQPEKHCCLHKYSLV